MAPIFSKWVAIEVPGCQSIYPRRGLILFFFLARSFVHSGTAKFMAHTPPPPVATDTDDILASLPVGYVRVNFSGFENLAKEAKSIYENLKANHSDGNQYLVVNNISNDDLDRLIHERHLLGVDYRLQWEVKTTITVVVKVSLPCLVALTARLGTMMAEKLEEMGIPDNDYDCG